MLYIEPTPYILGLVREVTRLSKTPVNTFFVCQDLTQTWGLSLVGFNAYMLSSGRLIALKQIWQIISTKPKVLHLAGWGHPVLLFALLVAGLLRVPVAIESDTQVPIGLPLWKRVLKRIVYPLLFKIPCVFLPGGKRQAAYFRYYGVNDNQINIANMTVDVSAIRKRCSLLGENGRKETRNRLNLDEKSIVFIFVGRLVVHKGLSDLIAFFERVNLNHPETRLLVVGDGPLFGGFSEKAKKQTVVQYLGRLDMDGVIEMYHAADVAVVPSHFEPWGLVVNEAMAAGLPVIASDRVGAVDDLVVDGVTGKIFTAGHIPELLAAMTELLDEQVRYRLSAAACELIDEWTLEKSAQKIIQAWRRAECGG